MIDRENDFTFIAKTITAHRGIAAIAERHVKRGIADIAAELVAAIDNIILGQNIR